MVKFINNFKCIKTIHILMNDDILYILQKQNGLFTFYLSLIIT